MNRRPRKIVKKKTIRLLLLLLFIASVSVTMAVKADITKDQLLSFVREFIDARKKNDHARMEELVKQAGSIVCNKVLDSLANNGFEEVAKGKDASFYFNTAEAIAATYAKVYKNERIRELVRRYKLYTQDMCKERLYGWSLLRQGLPFYQKSQWQEALERWTNALEIFNKLGEEIGEAAALFNIGLVHYQLDQYNEALDYFQKALKTSEGIGVVGVESQALLHIGHVYSDLRIYQDAMIYYLRALEVFRKIGDRASQADVHRRIGLIYNDFGQRGKALDSYKEALHLSRNLRDRDNEARDNLSVGIGYRDIYQYRDALDYYQQALEISRELDDKILGAMACSEIGLVYSIFGQYNMALEYFQQALDVFQKVEDIDKTAKVLANIGSVYGATEKYERALGYYQESLKMYREIDNIAGETEIFAKIGEIYGNLGQYAKALNYSQEALQISRKIKNAVLEAQSLMNIGFVYDYLGDYSKALENYKMAFEISQETEDIVCQALCLMNIGIIDYRLGEYYSALENLEEALKIFQKTEHAIGTANALMNTGIVYSSLGQYAEVLDYSQKALEVSKKIKAEITEGKILLLIGNGLFELDRFQESLYYYKNGLEKFIKMGDLRGVARATANIANVYSFLNQYNDTLEYCKKALEVCRFIGDAVGESHALYSLGLFSHFLGRYHEAIKTIQESLEISERLRSREITWRNHRILGRTLWKLGKPQEAINSYKMSDKTIEEVYSYTKGLKREERSTMIGEKSFVYREFIELLLELHSKFPEKNYDKEAFTVSEKAKSRLFQELMAQAGARTVFAGDETFQKIVGKEQQIIGEVSNLHSLFTKELSRPKKERNDEAINTRNEELSKAEKSLGEIEKEIETKYPRYADLKRPKLLCVEELQDILKPDETLLAYTVGEQKSAAFVIGKNRFKLVELEAGREELAKLIKQFRKGLDNVSELTIDLENFDPAISFRLYQEVFQPIAKELRGATQLFITADDLLYTLPFEALVDRPFDSQAFEEARKKGKSGKDTYLNEYAALHYLIETYTITYLPSASVLRSLREYSKLGYGQWSKPLIAFADPVFGQEGGMTENKDRMKVKDMSNETELAVQVITGSTGTRSLERLEESAEEAKAIAEEVGGTAEDIYLREEATEENIYHADLKLARYLLFSTHGLMGGDFSGVTEPALVLTLMGNPQGRDGFLIMSEVLGLDLNAEVVVLSACNTYGRGEKAGKGEGFAGLTRSFMYAGTKSIFVTHWSVESQAAKDLMVETFRGIQGHRGIKEGLRPDKALQNAKLNMRKSTFAPIKEIPSWKVSRSHPYFWAPFVLVGER